MKRPVVMILLAGALTLSMIAPSALPAAGNISVAQAAEKIWRYRAGRDIQ